MCRYALRPAVGQERLRISPEGQVVLDLRRRWAFRRRRRWWWLVQWISER